MVIDYSQLTEVPHAMATADQLNRMRTRYLFAGTRCRGKDVLEIACGSGQGLGLLSKSAKKVIAGDITYSLLTSAQSHYGNLIPLFQFDAHALPFRKNSFDAVILFEAIYYLKNPEIFINECQQILRAGGEVIVCLPNKSLPDFHSSAFSFYYFTPAELSEAFGSHGFQVTFFGDDFVAYSSFNSKVISFLKKTAVNLNLIPKTLKRREFLKRIFYGPLEPIPPDIEGEGQYSDPEPIRDKTNFRVIDAIAALK